MKHRKPDNMKNKSAWNKGKPWSQEIKAKISASRKGKTPWNKGARWGEIYKENMSKIKKGTVPWNKNRPWSEEVKAKLREAALKVQQKRRNHAN